MQIYPNLSNLLAACWPVENRQAGRQRFRLWLLVPSRWGQPTNLQNDQHARGTRSKISISSPRSRHHAAVTADTNKHDTGRIMRRPSPIHYVVGWRRHQRETQKRAPSACQLPTRTRPNKAPRASSYLGRKRARRPDHRLNLLTEGPNHRPTTRPPGGPSARVAHLTGRQCHVRDFQANDDIARWFLAATQFVSSVCSSLL